MPLDPFSKEARKLPCILDGIVGTDPAHIKSRGAGGSDHESNIVRLCRAHHTEQHAIGVTAFAETYPIYEQRLIDNGFEFDNLSNRWFAPANHPAWK